MLGGTLLANNVSGSATGLEQVLVAAGRGARRKRFVVPSTGTSATNRHHQRHGDAGQQRRHAHDRLGVESSQHHSSGNYSWEISQSGAQAAANTGGSSPSASHDILTINGTLALGSDWKIDLAWIGGGFDSAASYSWLVATASAGITGFTGNAVGSVTGFGGSVTPSDFSTSVVGNNLFLNFGFNPVPEPSSLLLAFVAAVVLAVCIGRRRTKQI